MLAMLLGALDQTIMTPALPHVAGDLGGLERIAWNAGKVCRAGAISIAQFTKM